MSAPTLELPLFRTRVFPESCARAFAPVPPEPIWLWAETWVWLKNETTAKPGPYASNQTPWTRRLQDLIRDPWQAVWSEKSQRWYWVPVRRVWIKKCSQSGFTEACLNGIRWSAKHRPRSCIYAIDSKEEAKNISERLSPTLARLGEEIFTGDDDDLGTYLMRLRSMRIYFMGSFSSGKFANKFASMCIADEVEEHKKASLNATDTLSDLESRAKTDDNGFIIGLSKPKKSTGPITKAHATGNREEWFVKCPHCDERQVVTFFEDQVEYPEMLTEIPYSAEIVNIVDALTGRTIQTWKPLPAGSEKRKLKNGRIVFEHCKDLAGAWDKEAILADTYFECGYCKTRIDEKHKPAMNAEALWLPTARGTPGVVSQRQSDLVSLDDASSWGQIVLHFLDAKSDRTKLMGWFNHRLGIDFKEETSEMDADDVRKNMGTYRRGTIPFAPVALFIGSDIGMSYARWVVCAMRADGALAVIDWGNEDSPGGVAEIVRDEEWPEAEFPDRKHKIKFGFMDAKYRKGAAQKACLATNGRMFPAVGGGSNTQRRAWTWNHYEKELPRWFGYLTFHDHDAKSSLYLDRYKKHEPAIFFPADIFKREHEERFVDEITKESLVTDEDGEVSWDDKHPNHFGDALKLCDLAYDYATRSTRPSKAAKGVTGMSARMAEAVKPS